MNGKTQGVLAIVAAFLVLFSAMWEPMVSLTMAVGGFGRRPYRAAM
ncbi:MAG TPA: hypothetical protein VEB69_13550 [Acidimicrobiia bacterium]|nr:hypothetical protein [Acidimicrobiia bacterium]